MTALNLPAGRDGKPRSWLMFFLRPVVLGPVTLFLLIIVAGLAYRSSRFSGIPPIDEIVNRETEGRIEIEPDENAFTFYERAFRLIPATLDEKAIGEAVDALDAGDVEWDAVLRQQKRVSKSVKPYLLIGNSARSSKEGFRYNQPICSSGT